MPLADVAKAISDLEAQVAAGSRQAYSFRDAILTAVHRQPHRALNWDRLDELFGTSHAKLFLDAWDEVPRELRDRLHSGLCDWIGQPGKPYVLLSSRVVGYPGAPWRLAERTEQEREMELLPFDADQQQAFVRAYFVSDAAPVLRNVRQKDARLS